MSTSKKPITFYADEEITKWYDSLPQGHGSREICKMIKRGLQAPSEHDLELRVETVVHNLDELRKRFKFLEQRLKVDFQKAAKEAGTDLPPPIMPPPDYADYDEWTAKQSRRDEMIEDL